MAGEAHENPLFRDAEDCHLAIRLILDGRPEAVQIAALRGISTEVAVVGRTRIAEIKGVLKAVAANLEMLANELDAPMGTLAVEKTRKSLATQTDSVRRQVARLDNLLTGAAF